MKLVNIGCGAVYHPAWINLDSAPTSAEVRRVDARDGLPFADGEVDAVYHAHMLEHLDVASAKIFLRECHRVLRPAGILRVVVPDLEGIAQAYLRELALTNTGGDSTLYEWTRMELTDQASRSQSGGAMAPFLGRLTPAQVAVVRSRAGNEVDSHVGTAGSGSRLRRATPAKIWRFLRRKIVGEFAWLLGGSSFRVAWEEGVFRQSGEVHRVMYDRVALAQLLLECGFADAKKVNATESEIPGYAGYELDAVNGVTRKPDSLFMEAIRQ